MSNRLWTTTGSSCAANCRSSFPAPSFSFLPGDITAKILNFGLPAPIDVQISGRGQAANMAYAQQLAARIGKIPGSCRRQHPAGVQRTDDQGCRGPLASPPA